MSSGSQIGWTAPATCTGAFKADCKRCKDEAARSPEEASADTLAEFQPGLQQPATAMQPSSMPDSQHFVDLLSWLTRGVPLLLHSVLNRLVQHVQNGSQSPAEMCCTHLRSLFVGKNAMLIEHPLQDKLRCTAWSENLDQQTSTQLFVRALLHLPLDTNSLTDLSRALVRADVHTGVWSGCDSSEGTSYSVAGLCLKTCGRLQRLFDGSLDTILAGI